MSFIIKNDIYLHKYNEIWDQIKGKLNIKFDENMMKNT